jgi:hypothetical protein
LARLATKRPANAKESFVQLLAIRWLAEHANQQGTDKQCGEDLEAYWSPAS